MTEDEREGTDRLERQNAYSLFEVDPFGFGDALFGKRLARSWKSTITAGTTLESVREQTEAIVWGQYGKVESEASLSDDEFGCLVSLINHPVDRDQDAPPELSEVSRFPWT